MDVDKAWHGIHFLLTGEVWGGEPPLANRDTWRYRDRDDVGYGPARYLSVDEVRAAAAALKDITPDGLRSRYVAAELSENEIYPASGTIRTRCRWIPGRLVRIAPRLLPRCGGQADAMLKYLN